MHKLLPILLFAFLIAEENQEPNFVQSDSLDVIWAEEQLDSDLNEFKKQVANIINEDKFLINVDKKVNEVVRVDTTYHEMNTIKYKIIIDYKINIEVNIDKSIELDNSVKQTIESIINIIFQFSKWKIENITFNSVDINKLKNKNNKISLNRDDIYGDSWAVIIGIDKYKYSDQLNYAVKDAEAVKDMLINKFDYPEENIRYLTDEEATLSNIKLNLGEVATSAGEDDRILVFYSGHGQTLSGKDGTETGYIIPYEGKQNNPYATGLVMDEILRTCQMSDAKHMLFLMDACYSGLMTENVKGLSKPQEQGYLSKVANESARQIITAGDSDEQVIERDEWQHSAFTKNLLEGLDTWEADYNEDGCITADELSTYLRENVTEDSDFQQTPQDGRFRNSGRGEFVFFANNMEVDIVNNNTSKSFFDDSIKDVNDNADWLMKPIKHPYNLSMIYFAHNGAIAIHKKLNNKSGIGLGYIHMENNYLSDELSTISKARFDIHEEIEIISPIGYYYLLSNPYPLFNPALYFSLGLFNIKMEQSIDTQFESMSNNRNTRNFTYQVGILNHMQIAKHFGTSFGINIFRMHHYEFDDMYEIYLDYSSWIIQPVLTVDILYIHNPFKKSDS